MLETRAIAATLRRIARPDMTPKALIAAVRQRHPDATKKEIVRAAFYSLTDSGTGDEEQGRHLHDFALSQRMDGDGDAPSPQRLGRRDRRDGRKAQSGAP